MGKTRAKGAKNVYFLAVSSHPLISASNSPEHAECEQDLVTNLACKTVKFSICANIVNTKC